MWYKSFDIYVQASRAPEPFATTVVEAAFCKRAIVATDTGGTSEFVENGKTGILVKPTVTALQEGLERVIEDSVLRQKLGQNAYLKASQFFSEEAITRTLENIYTFYK